MNFLIWFGIIWFGLTFIRYYYYLFIKNKESAEEIKKHGPFHKSSND
jgi:cbb3-type cytochrome oxidase subunit 3